MFYLNRFFGSISIAVSIFGVISAFAEPTSSNAIPPDSVKVVSPTPAEKDSSAGANAENSADSINVASNAPIEKDSTAGANAESNADSINVASNAPLEKDSTASANTESNADSTNVASNAPLEKDSSAGANTESNADSINVASNAPLEKDSSANAGINTADYSTRHPFGIGILYEISSIKKANVAYHMTRKGKRYHVDVDISNMIGVAGQYAVNNWISLFGAFSYNRFDIDYTPKDKSSKKKSTTADNLLLQGGFEIGFSFIRSTNYQIRALGFLGGMFGYSILDDDYYRNPLIFGYVRGIGLQASIRRFAVFAGFRSTHYYFHTYNGHNWKEDDHSFMLDFDTMSCPFFSVGIGF